MTFFKKVEAEIELLFKKAPTWTTTASTTIKYVAPLLETVLAFTNPAAEAIVAPLITTAQADLATASVLIKDAGPTPTLTSSLNSFVTNLSAIEAAADIKDPATQTKFTAAVTLISGEVSAILTAIPSTTK